MHRLFVLLSLLSISAVRAEKIPFHATSLNTSFAIAGEVAGTFEMEGEKITVIINDGNIVRKSCPYTGKRTVKQISALLTTWNPNRRSCTALVYSAPFPIDKSIVLGETIPVSGAKFEIPVPGFTREQLEKSWLAFSIVSETLSEDGKPLGGSSDIHTAVSLFGAPTGFPVRREKTASGELKILEDALVPAMTGLTPQAKISFLPDEKTMHVDFRTKAYETFERSVVGGVVLPSRYERGPDEQGFMLTAQMQDPGTPAPADVAAAFQSGNWKTETAVTPVAGTQKQVSWTLCYGAQTDPALVEKLKLSLNSLAK